MNKQIFACLLLVNVFAFSQENTNLGSTEKFIEFLNKSLENKNINTEATKGFYKQSWSFWMAHLTDYYHNPDSYSKALALFHENQQIYVWNRDININRFEDQIENFRRFDNRNTLAKNPILFIGSSSIAYWETSKYFPEYPIINRGFGGASIPEIIYYYDDVIKKHKPSTVIIYCDIDIENGKPPSEAIKAFKELINKIELDFPKTQIVILSMKPTLIDVFIGKNVRNNKRISNKELKEYCSENKQLHYLDVTNKMYNSKGKLRSDIFLPDGMHLNELGYTLWSKLVKDQIKVLSKE